MSSLVSPDEEQRSGHGSPRKCQDTGDEADALGSLHRGEQSITLQVSDLGFKLSDTSIEEFFAGSVGHGSMIARRPYSRPVRLAHSGLGLVSPDEPRADPESRVKYCKGVDEHAVNSAGQAEGYEEERHQ